jgi:glycosyltransferase involved in cell wall biosynthesis
MKFQCSGLFYFRVSRPFFVGVWVWGIADTIPFAMRILFFSYEYPPLGGGIATAVFNIFRVISEKHPNIHIDCITSSITNTWSSKQVSPNITLHFVPIGNKEKQLKTQTPLNMLLYTVFATYTGLQLVWTARSTQNPFLLSHAFGYPGPFPSFVLSLFGLPYVVSLRGVDVPGYNKKFGFWYTFYTPLIKFIWNRASQITANSYVLQRLAQKIYSKPIAVIPNGVDTDKYKPVAENKKFPKFTVTGGGTLMNPKKRVDLLVKGFAAFVKENSLSESKVELLLIGDGPERTNIEELVDELAIRPFLRFVGEKPSSWLQENLPKCHVFCLMSQAESNSNAVLEAAACGLPLVLAEGIGNLEFMGEGGAMEVEESTVEKASDTVAGHFLTLYSNEELRTNQAKLAREYAEQYSWEAVSVKIVEQLLAHNPHVVVE